MTLAIGPAGPEGVRTRLDWAAGEGWNPGLADAAPARRHGLAPVFETARMYTRGDPGLPLSRIFGITTFELG